MSVQAQVKTNSGLIPAEVIKVNNKTVIVKVSKDILVKVPAPAIDPEALAKSGKQQFILERRTITKHIKRKLSDLQTA